MAFASLSYLTVMDFFPPRSSTISAASFTTWMLPLWRSTVSSPWSLKPKSTSEVLRIPSATRVTDWAVPESPAVNTKVAVFIVVPAAPFPGSARAGLVPPTQLVTATAEPDVASVRKVWTDLFKTAQRLAAELGVTLEESATGGGSDGNFTATLGVPTLDGLGAVGEGAHALHESILVDRIADRTALLAKLVLAI